MNKSDKKRQKATKKQTQKDIANSLGVSVRTIQRLKKTDKLPKILEKKDKEEKAQEIVESLKTDAEYKAEIRTRGLMLLDSFLKELVDLKIDYKKLKDYKKLDAKLKAMELLLKS